MTDSNVVYIPLGRSGEVAIVDAADAWVLERRWYLERNSNAFRVRQSCRTNGERGRPLHRLLTNAPPGKDVDHRDGNPLNNRRSNIRIASKQENQRNRYRPWGSSKFKGVNWYKLTKCWRAGIKYGGKARHIGYFHDEIEAARAYDQVAIEHFGEFARTNESLGLFEQKREAAA